MRIHKILQVSFCTIFLLLLPNHSLWSQSVAEWQTTMGTFRIELREDLVPITAGNFIDLTNDDFYDGVIFHRVIDDFMIQDGDPTGTGYGGPGYNIPDEFHPDLLHDGPGVLSMANTGQANSGGSQYFITLVPTPWLNAYDENGELKNCALSNVSCHAVFGRILEGMDVVYAIGAVDTDANDRPIVDVVINDLNILGIIYPHLELSETEISDSPPNSDGDGVINPSETGQLYVRIRNLAGWLDAEGVTAELSSVDSRILITTGFVDLGTIANGDSLDNADNLFEFEALSPETFTTSFNLQLSANQNSDYPYQIDYEIELPITLNQTGWPYYIGSSTTSSALIADIDRDDNNELIFGDNERNLHVLAADGQTELAGFPLTLGHEIRSAVAIANINQDDALEIVVTPFSNQIMAVDFGGNVIFSYEAVGDLMSNPMIADVDGNGSLEIIAFTIFGELVVLNADGTDFDSFPYFLSAAVVASPATADLDGDGNLEIIAVSVVDGGTLHAISTVDATEVAGWPYVSGSNSNNGPIVADIDRDELPEVLVAFANGTIVALNHDGSEVFNRDIGSSVSTSIVAADIDLMDDDSIEIAFVTNDGSLYVLDQYGNDIYGFPQDLGTTVQSTPILADLNNNSTADIIFGDDSGYLHAIDIDGSPIPGFPVFIGGNIEISPAIGDLDRDGDVDIAIPNYEAYFVLDVKQDGLLSWPCFKANQQRTGNLADVTTGIEDEIIVPAARTTFLGNCYPNPLNLSLPGRSNNRATITFGLSDPSSVSLGIYDVSGRLVKTLARGKRPAGVHTVAWTGQDDRDRAVGSGVYFYRLESDNFSQTKRMVLLK